MNNAEAVEKLLELATKYNTVYVNGTVGQALTNHILENTEEDTSICIQGFPYIRSAKAIIPKKRDRPAGNFMLLCSLVFICILR